MNISDYGNWKGQSITAVVVTRERNLYNHEHVLGSDHTVVSIEVRDTKSDRNVLSSDLTFYNCAVHQSCGSCTDSVWGCVWCIYDNSCRATSKECNAVSSGLKKTVS